MKFKFKKNEGQALISLLVFSVIGIAVSGVTTAITINSRLQNALAIDNIKAENGALSGVEIALLSIIRNQSYIGETITIDGVNIAINVTTGEKKEILVSSQSGDSVYKIRSEVEFEDNRLVVNSKMPVY